MTRTVFVGGDTGAWRVISSRAVRGETLPQARALDRIAASEYHPARLCDYALQGVISNLRYATRDELTALQAVQEPLGRPVCRHAALIPIAKSAAWWALAQNERRAVFEEQSRHTAIGLAYLPAIARQLYHARDLGEPFDFLTWFEYAPEQATAFEELVSALRETHEWHFVEREIDIRLERT